STYFPNLAEKLEESVFPVYDHNNKLIQDKLQELSEIMEKIRQIENELKQVCHTVEMMYKDLCGQPELGAGGGMRSSPPDVLHGYLSCPSCRQPKTWWDGVDRLPCDTSSCPGLCASPTSASTCCPGGCSIHTHLHGAGCAGRMR
uniref:Uncharacterized protein n=1 Tax=Pseudonaja textilis TaxID=8673 RepID=A0A670ZX81_PSETE